MIFIVVSTTDGKHCGTALTSLPEIGDVIELGGYRMPVVEVVRAGEETIVANPNYVVKLRPRKWR